MVGYPSNKIVTVGAGASGQVVRLSNGLPARVSPAVPPSGARVLSKTLGEFLDKALGPEVGVVGVVADMAIEVDRYNARRLGFTSVFDGGFGRVPVVGYTPASPDVFDPAGAGWQVIVGPDGVPHTCGGGGTDGPYPCLGSYWAPGSSLPCQDQGDYAFPPGGLCHPDGDYGVAAPGDVGSGQFGWSMSTRTVEYDGFGQANVRAAADWYFPSDGASDYPDLVVSGAASVVVDFPVWRPVEVERGGSVITAVPVSQVRAPPGPGVKERKFKGSGLLNALRAAEHEFTEAKDVVDALWGAIPKKLRTSAKCGTPGTLPVMVTGLNITKGAGDGCYVSLGQKMKDIYEHFQEIPVEDAVRALINNDIGDRFTGAQFGAAATFGNKIGVKTTGILNVGAVPPPQFDKNWNLVWTPVGNTGPKVTVPSSAVLTRWAN